MKLVKVEIAMDKVETCYFNPEQIEMVKRNANGSCVFFLKSGKIWGCLQSIEEVAKAGDLELIEIGNVSQNVAETKLNEAVAAQTAVKQPVAVITERGKEVTSTGKVKKKRVIDNKAPSAVITGGRKKTGSKKASNVRRVPRGTEARPMAGEGVEVKISPGAPA